MWWIDYLPTFIFILQEDSEIVSKVHLQWTWRKDGEIQPWPRTLLMKIFNQIDCFLQYYLKIRTKRNIMRLLYSLKDLELKYKD